MLFLMSFYQFNFLTFSLLAPILAPLAPILAFFSLFSPNISPFTDFFPFSEGVLRTCTSSSWLLGGESRGRGTGWMDGCVWVRIPLQPGGGERP